MAGKQKEKRWKIKHVKRHWLNTKPDLNAFVSWKIEGSEHKHYTELDAELVVADCSRSVHLDFGHSEYDGRSTGKQIQEKIDLFRNLMNEFCDQAEDALIEYEKAHKRSKKRAAAEKAAKKKKK